LPVVSSTCAIQVTTVVVYNSGNSMSLEVAILQMYLPPNVFHVCFLLFAVIAAFLHAYLYAIIGEAFQVSILY
jgi:hypothetical protein